MVHRSTVAAVAVGAFALVAVTWSNALATNDCAGAKKKAAGKKAACLLSLEAKEATKGDPIDPLKIAKCAGKFSSAFAKAEGKPPCTTTGDTDDVEDKVDMFVADVDSELVTGTLPNGCQGSKIKAAGKKAKCLLGLEAKQASKGGSIDPLKLAKCTGKFSSAFAKAEGKGGCNTTGDTDDLEDKVDMFVADVDGEIPDDLPPTTTTTVYLPPCGFLPGPECGGACPTGEHCGAEYVPPGGARECHCFPDDVTACGDSYYPTCGGVCTQGWTCQAVRVLDGSSLFLERCDCVEPTSTCGPPASCPVPGPCPVGEVCEVNLVVGEQCGCTP